MGLGKLIKKLQKNLAKGEKNDNKDNLEHIDELLERIKHKEKKLKESLSAEKDKSERKHLKLELKIASLEYRKGLKQREELGKNKK